MKTAFAGVAILSLALFAPQAGAGSADFVSLVRTQRPDVRWDANSQIAEDFNGDGKLDLALLGYTEDQVVLAVKTSRRSKSGVQYLAFGINGGRQAAICGTPAKLSSESFSCSYEDSNQRLPGCRKSRHARGLSLSGGDCDPIHLYLNHVSDEMSWWRE